MPDSEMTIAECLRPTTCINCGYSLAGLQIRGACPECGREYGQSEIVLYGWGRGRHERIWNAKGSRVIWVLAWPALWIGFQLFMQSFTQARQVFAMELGIVVVASVLIMAYAIWRRRESVHPGLVQIRLNNQGCVQYDDLASSSIIQELWYQWGWLIPVIVIGLITFFAFHDSRYFILHVVLFIICVVGEVLLWRLSRRYRKAKREVREGAIADANAAFYELTAWNLLNSFSLSHIETDFYRLKVNRDSFIHRNDVVDAEIKCSADQAEHIKQLLQQQINLAKNSN